MEDRVMTAPSLPIDLLTVLNAARDWADRIYVGNQRVRLIIVTSDNQKVAIPVPNKESLAVPPGDPGPADVMEQSIVDVLTGAESLLTGEEVALKAGYSFSGRFKQALARLVKHGWIINRRPGYSQREAG